MNDISLAYLRPGQILERLRQAPVVFIPIGPLEWHGPHMPYGTDALNAQHTALECCRRTGGVVWPTLFWGTERERRPEQLDSLGFAKTDYVVGMDFPANSLKSGYCPEEILAVLVREVLRECLAMKARLAVIVNGHGAENHMALLRRLSIEFTNTTPLRVHFRVAGPTKEIQAGSGGHADAGETALMMHLTKSVDLGQLPPLPQRLRFVDYAVVDGGGFDGKTADHILPDISDPRRNSTADLGRRTFETTVAELEEQVKGILREMGL